MLAASFAGNFTPVQIASLTTAEINDLTTDELQNLSTAQLNALTADGDNLHQLPGRGKASANQRAATA